MLLTSLLFETILVAVLGFLDIHHTEACSVPYIREKSENEVKVIKVSSGKDVQLICRIRSTGQIPKPGYYWLKDNQTLIPSAHQRMKLKPYRYLKIKRVKKEDAGFYTCVVVNDCGKNPHTMQLIVGAAPDLRKEPPLSVVEPVGQDKVKLVCNVRGAVNYTWYKDNKKIHQLTDRYVVKAMRYLEITDLVKSDSGFFVCVTSNKYGTTNCTTRLIVKDPTVSPTNVSGAVKPRFLHPDEMAKAKSQYTEGDKFRLTCEATGKPIPTVTWYKDKTVYHGRPFDEKITPGHYHYEIYFNGVDTKDRGNYTCVVKNSLGSLAHSYVFDVKEKIRSVPQMLSIWEQKDPEYAGTNLQLFCTALSKDIKTEFRWYFSESFDPNQKNPGALINQTLFQSRLMTSPNDGSWLKWKSVLNLKNLSVADSGSYLCQAINIKGPGERRTFLDVTTRPITPSPAAVKPRFLHPDEMAKAKSQYTEGDKFRLTCEATGKPIPKVTWYKDKDVYRGRRSDETIKPGYYHYNISFIGVDTKDRGNYTCVVKNSHGSLAHSYVFDVKGN